MENKLVVTSGEREGGGIVVGEKSIIMGFYEIGGKSKNNHRMKVN